MDKNNCTESVIFSKRDYLNKNHFSGENLKYHKKKCKEGSLVKTLLTLLIIPALTLLFLTVIFNLNPDFQNPDNFRYFLSASTQVLGTILGMILTISLIFIQINIQKYGDNIYSYILSKIDIIISILFILFTIVFSLTNILFIQHSDPLATLIHLRSIEIQINHMSIISYILIVISFAILPVFIYRLIEILKSKNYIRSLYNSLIQHIKKEETRLVENCIYSLTNIINNGIEERNLDIISEGIESLHDLIKYSINNQKDIFNLSKTVNREDGRFSYHSGWFEEEILNSYYYFFTNLVRTQQYNSARFLIRALYSCGKESLHTEAEYYQRRLIVNTYQKVLLFCSTENINVPDTVTDDFKDFFRSSLCLDSMEFEYLVYDIFDYDFIIKSLKTNPSLINTISSEYFHGIANRMRGQVTNSDIKNVLSFIERLSYIIQISNNLIERNMISDPLIEKENIFLIENLSDYVYLISLYLYSKGYKKEATDCKKLFKQCKMKQNQILTKIKNLGKSTGYDRFNYLIQHLFNEEEYNKIMEIATEFSI